MLRDPILSRAVKLLVYDPAETLRVTAPGLILLFLGQFCYGHFVLVPLDQGLSIYRITLHATVVVCTLAVVIVNVPLHRYLLLDDASRRNHGRPHLKPYILYVLHAFCLAGGAFSSVMGAGALVLYLVTRGAAVDGVNDLWPLDTAPGMFLCCVVWFWFMLHFGLTLPAAAVNHGLSIRDGFLETTPLSSKLLLVAIVLATVSFGQSFLWFTPTGLLVPIYAAVATAIIYLQALLVTGILSALYGSLIQGRRL